MGLSLRTLWPFLGAVLLADTLPAQAQAPQVTSLVPSRNAFNVPRTTAITVTFSQAMQAATASPAGLRVFSTQRGGLLAGTYSGAGTASASFQPAQPFQPGERVQVLLPRTVQNQAGVLLDKPQTLEFQVAASPGPGQYQAGPDLVGTGALTNYVYAVDIDGDQDLDLVSHQPNGALNYVTLHVNGGRGNFSGPTTVSTDAFPQALAVGDLDGDGDIDVVTGNDSRGTTGTISVRLNDGSGSFTPHPMAPQVATGTRPRKLALVDLDGDGDLDIVATSTDDYPSNPSRYAVCILKNDGQGHFTRQPDYPVGGSGAQVTFADIDTDGDLDFLLNILKPTGERQVVVHLNDGFGTFSPHPVQPVVTSVTTSFYGTLFGPTLADLDNDGDVDLIVSGFYPTNAVVRFNDGTGVFTGTTTLAGTGGSFLLDVADMDGNGTLDLVFGNTISNLVTILANSGTGTFQARAPAIPVPYPRAMHAADLDRDGDLDMVVVNGEQGGLEIRLNQVPTWTGAVSSDWNTAGNWLGGTLPTATLDAEIPAGAPRYPELTTGTYSARKLTVASNARLTLQGGILDLKGDVVLEGTLTQPGGLVRLSSALQQTIQATSTPVFWDVEVGAAGSLLSGPVHMQHLLQLNGNLTSNGNLTLLSNSTATAMVVNSGGIVNGTATVQRYIDPSLNPGLGYRHYSSPVQSTAVADLATSTFAPVVNSDYNTLGNTVNPFPTVYGYNEARITGVSATTQDFDYGYFSPGSLGETLSRGRGYTVNIAASEKIDLVGTLNSGTVPVGALSRDTQANSGWHLLGNPYPAPLDWKKVQASGLPVGVIDAVYVYKSGSQYGGTYQFYQNGFGTLPSGIIGSMQGFFVRVSQPVTAFNFQDTWRSTTYETAAFNRPTADARPALQLDLVSAQGSRDPAYVYFEDGATPDIDDHYDAAKLPNTTGLNLASVAAGTGLAVNGLPLLQTTTVVPLTVGIPVTGAYTLQVTSLANFGSTPVYLLDAVTGQQVDLKQQTTYSFSASNTDLITGRFSLNFGGLRPLATSSNAMALSVILYPNPARNMAWVELPAELSRQPVTATLLNAVGRVVRTQKLPAGQAKAYALSIAELPAGVYLLRLHTETSLVTKRLIIE